jgi:predicted nucleic acid-binding protein
MRLVIDCSFIMATVLPDEKQNKVNILFSQIANRIYNIYVPSIFFLECSNVLLYSLKRKRIGIKDYEEYLNFLEQLPLNVDKFSSTPESLFTISKIATKYDLTSYDSAYLELALRMEAALATLDKNLSDRGAQVGINLLL